MAEPEVEINHLSREFMVVEITNRLAMVAKLRNRSRLQSLQVLAPIEIEIIEYPRNFTVGFQKIGVVVGDQTLIR